MGGGVSSFLTNITETKRDFTQCRLGSYEEQKGEWRRERHNGSHSPPRGWRGVASGEVHGSAKVAGPRLAFGHHSTRNPDEVRQESGVVRYGS